MAIFMALVETTKAFKIDDYNCVGTTVVEYRRLEYLKYTALDEDLQSFRVKHTRERGCPTSILRTHRLALKLYLP